MLLSAKLLASTDKQNQNQKKQPQKIRKIYKQHQIHKLSGTRFFQKHVRDIPQSPTRGQTFYTALQYFQSSRSDWLSEGLTTHST